MPPKKPLATAPIAPKPEPGLKVVGNYFIPEVRTLIALL